MILRFAYLVLVIAPIIVIAGSTIPAVVSDPTITALLLPSGRRLDLLIDSLMLAGLTALITTVFGFLAALALTTGKLSRRPVLRWFPVALAVLPPYVHALVWTQALAWLTTIVSRQQLHPPPFEGFAIALWVEVMAWLPLAIALALIALIMLPRETIESARMSRSHLPVLARIILPLSAPLLISSGCLIFVLALTNYEVPSLFSMTTYSLEIFAEFSTSHEAGRAALIAVPLLVAASLALLTGLAAMLKVLGRRIDSPINGFETIPWRWPRAFLTTLRLALLILTLQILVPVLTLILGSGSLPDLVRSIVEARTEISFSLHVAIVAALLAPPLAHAVAKRLDTQHLHWWIMAILPLAVPAPLVGIGLIKMFNPLAPLWLLDSMALPVAVVLARFTPFAILIFYAGIRNQSSDPIDAVRVFQPNPIAGWLKIRLRLILPIYLAAAGLVFALSLGELGATLLVAPPGRSSLSIRIYNYLHYGASESVHGLSLAILVTTTLASIIAIRFIAGQTRKAHL